MARRAWSRDLLAGVAVFIAGLGVRLVYLRQISRSPFYDFLQLDPRYYHDWATRIVQGEWIGTEVFEMSPLYSYMLALFMLAFGDDMGLLRILQAVIGSGTCVLTYMLGSRLFGRSAGILAGLGCAMYGPFLFYEGQVMKEFLTPPLATGALLLVLRARPWPREGPSAEFGAWPLAGAGALIGLAALVRDNFLVLMPMLVAWLLLESGRRLAPPLWLLAGALAVLLPVGARNAAVGGGFVLTTSGGGEVFYIGNGPYANGAYVPPPWVRSNPRFEHEDFRAKARELTGRPLTRAEASQFWWKEGLKWMAAHPAKACLLWLRKLGLLWNDHELPDNYSFYTFRDFAPLLSWCLTFGPVAALAWAGIVLTAADWRRLLPVYLVGVGYMISVLIFFNFARFRLPLVPILLAFAARAAVGLWEAGRALASRRSAPRRTLVAALVVAAAVPFLFIDWSSAWEEPFQDRLHLGAAYRQAGHPQQAESVLRKVIEDAEAVIRRHGGDPSSASSTPGGVTFALALAAAHSDLGGALTDQKRYAEAAQSYRRAVALSPDDAALWMSLGASLKEAGDLPGAEEALLRAADLDSKSFAARFDLATVRYRMGKLEQALADLEAARRAGGDLPQLSLADYHYGMGAVLYALPGREREAADHFREALALNPDADQAAEVRAALKAIELSLSSPGPSPEPRR